jgi:aminoglycoside/choline kinase family phosphotransferase
MTDPLLPLLEQLVARHLPALFAPPVALRGDGSDRQIYRFLGDNGFSWVGVTNPAQEENRAFLEMSRHFRQQGIPVPEIYAEDRQQLVYLLEDLGDQTLADWLMDLDPDVPGAAVRIRKVYQEALELLIQMQTKGTVGFDRNWCHAAPESNTALFQADLQYFRQRFWEVFVPNSPVTIALKEELSALAETVGKLPKTVFVSRDFQSRNLMWHHDRLYVIDYQSGGIGAPHYDLAALLHASKAGLNEALREQLLGDYQERAARHRLIDPKYFIGELEQFVLLRRLRSLGTYGYLSAIKGKWYFLDSIPGTIREVHRMLNERQALHRLTALRALFEELQDRDELRDNDWLRQKAQMIASQNFKEKPQHASI